jgi:hypothetical protein
MKIIEKALEVEKVFRCEKCDHWHLHRNSKQENCKAKEVINEKMIKENIIDSDMNNKKITNIVLFLEDRTGVEKMMIDTACPASMTSRSVLNAK